MVRMQPPRVQRLDLRMAALQPKRVDPVYATAEYRIWARAVKRRDGYRCQWPGCDARAPLARMVAAHIRAVNDGGAPYDLANGRCLCTRHNVVEGVGERAARQRGGGG